jgi:hypothetical protein
MSITSRLRGCAAVRGCTAARQPCSACTAVRKRRTAARLRAAVRDGRARSQLRGLSLSSKLKLCIHARVPTEGGRGRAAAQAAARPGAPPGASALIASAAIAIAARCSARRLLSRRIAARLPGPKMAARLARWPHGCTRTAGEMAALLSRCCETALRLRGCAASGSCLSGIRSRSHPRLNDRRDCDDCIGERASTRRRCR